MRAQEAAGDAGFPLRARRRCRITRFRRSQIERILRVPRRMIGGSVQGIEAMIFVFDFGTIGDHESNFAKAADDVFGDLGEWMKFAQATASPRQSKIGRFAGESGLEFELGAAVG